MSVAEPKRDRSDNLICELTFTEGDLVDIDVPHNDALVLRVNICNFDVMRVLIDPKSSSEVIYLNLYEKLKKFIPANNVRVTNALIYSFSSDPLWPICIVKVPVRIWEVIVNVEFFIMNIDSPYNSILGRSWLGT